MKPPPTNIATSVNQRLLNLAKATGRPFNEIAQHYALERWLHRLGQSKHRETFVLKGALMLLAWRIPSTRPTRDIDLLGRINNDPESVRQAIFEICSVPVEADGMTFDPSRIEIERIAEDAIITACEPGFAASSETPNYLYKSTLALAM